MHGGKQKSSEGGVSGKWELQLFLWSKSIELSQLRLSTGNNIQSGSCCNASCTLWVRG